VSKLPDKEIIKNIILKSNDKFNTAKELFQNKHYDDSVSRTYYSIFHIITAVLFSKNLTFSSHKETIGAFNKEFIKTKLFPIDFYKKIDSLFNNRHIGDYDVKRFIDKETAELNIKDADDIIKKCKEYLSDLYKTDKDYWNK